MVIIIQYYRDKSVLYKVGAFVNFIGNDTNGKKKKEKKKKQVWIFTKDHESIVISFCFNKILI